MGGEAGRQTNSSSLSERNSERVELQSDTSNTATNSVCSRCNLRRYTETKISGGVCIYLSLYVQF